MTDPNTVPADAPTGAQRATIIWTLNPPASHVPLAYTIENICDSWPHESTRDWCNDEYTKTVRYIFDGGHPVLAICLACYADMYGITPAEVPERGQLATGKLTSAEPERHPL